MTRSRAVAAGLVDYYSTYLPRTFARRVRRLSSIYPSIYILTMVVKFNNNKKLFVKLYETIREIVSKSYWSRIYRLCNFVKNRVRL